MIKVDELFKASAVVRKCAGPANHRLYAHSNLPKQPSPISTASTSVLSKHCRNSAGKKDGP